MAIQFHPDPGTVLICDFTGFREPEMVKRALVSKGQVVFVSDNPDGDHNWKEPRPLADGLKIVGRVRWTGGWVK